MFGREKRKRISVGQDITLQSNRPSECRKFQADDTDAEVTRTIACLSLYFGKGISYSLEGSQREAVFFSLMIAESATWWGLFLAIRAVKNKEGKGKTRHEEGRICCSVRIGCDGCACRTRRNIEMPLLRLNGVWKQLSQWCPCSQRYG